MKKTSSKELTKRDRILLAAEEVFSKRGYTQATLDEIIALADTGKGTLYKYFGNKDNLFYVLVCQKHELLMADFETAAREGLGVENKLYRVLDVWVNFLLNNMVLWQVTMFEMTGGNRGYRAYKKEDGSWGLTASWGEMPSKEVQDTLLKYHALLLEESKALETIFLEGAKAGFFEDNFKPIDTAHNMFFSVAMIVVNCQETPKDGEGLRNLAESFTQHFLYGMAKNK